MPNMNMVQSVNSALDNMLESDRDIVIFGEDVGYFGGVFRTSDGLQEKHGKHRVFDSPLSEGGIAATAFGMGINGLRPVVEIQFADYIFPAYDQIVNEMAKVRHRSGGEFWCPVTIRTPVGGGIRGGHHHSQSPEAQFTHTPGLKVVYCSTPFNSKGLLISAIEDNDPVIFFEHRWLHHLVGNVKKNYYTKEIGLSRYVSRGKDLTIITFSYTVIQSLKINKLLLENNISAEIIDLVSLRPLDNLKFFSLAFFIDHSKKIIDFAHLKNVRFMSGIFL